MTTIGKLTRKVFIGQGVVHQPDALLIVVSLPPKSLHPNARTHWAAKMRATKKYRSDCYLAAVDARNRAQLNTPYEAATCQATFYFRERRRRDDDNLNAWLKSARDGLTDARIWVDDSKVTNLPPVVCIGEPRVELVVREVRG